MPFKVELLLMAAEYLENQDKLKNQNSTSISSPLVQQVHISGSPPRSPIQSVVHGVNGVRTVHLSHSQSIAYSTSNNGDNVSLYNTTNRLDGRNASTNGSAMHQVLQGGDESTNNINLTASPVSYPINNGSTGMISTPSTSRNSTNNIGGLQFTGMPISGPNGPTSSRRRTISTASTGSNNPRATRESHNKLEKNRRAHLRECFEMLRKQLPEMPEEKKFSNLAILGAALKTIQMEKKKSIENEREMERIAKDKIALRQKLDNLKRDIQVNYDVDVTALISEDGLALRDITGVDGNTILLQQSNTLGRFGTVGTNAEVVLSSSAITNSISTISRTVSPASMHNSHSINSNNNSRINTIDNKSISPLTSIGFINKNGTSDTIKTAVPLNGIIKATMPNGLLSGAINLSTNDSIISPVTLLNTTNNGNTLQQNQGLQIISTSKDLNSITGKNGVRTITHLNDLTGKDMHTVGTKVELINQTKIDQEPPAKLIKLNGVNGTITLTTNVVDKDSLAQVTQVMGGGSLLVSQVPQMLNPNGLRVISGQNGLPTIEVGNPSAQRGSNGNVTQQQSAQLHKLLVGGNQATNGNGSTIVTSVGGTAITSESARLPGGAELNILPAGVNGAAVYRSNGKVQIVPNNGITIKGSDVNNSGGRAVQLVSPLQTNGSQITGLTPIVVTQNCTGTSMAQFIGSPSQLTGKMISTPLTMNGTQAIPLVGHTQYLSTMVKPLMVAVTGNGIGNGNSGSVMVSSGQTDLQPVAISNNSIVVPNQVATISVSNSSKNGSNHV